MQEVHQRFGGKRGEGRSRLTLGKKMSVVHVSLHVPVTFCHSLGNLGVPHKPGGGGATQSMNVGDNCETSRPHFWDVTSSKLAYV